jgi:uncharacterized protein (DUF427 family)
VGYVVAEAFVGEFVVEGMVGASYYLPSTSITRQHGGRIIP